MNNDTANALVFGVIGCGIAGVTGLLHFASSPSVSSAALFVVSGIVLVGFVVNALSAVR